MPLTLLLLAGILTACADTPPDATAAPLGSPSPLGATVPNDAPPPVLVAPAEAMAEIQPPDAGSPDWDPHSAWFGDSGWDCCTRRLCVGLCDGGDIPVEDPTGRRVCCVPSIGQCDDLDAGQT